MKRVLLLVVLVVGVVMLTGCAAGPNTLEDVPDPEGEVAGFLPGLWNGIIAPITFVISLFNDNVSMYNIYNNGGWYNFGFLLGFGSVWGGGGSGASRARRRRDK